MHDIVIKENLRLELCDKIINARENVRQFSHIKDKSIFEEIKNYQDFDNLNSLQEKAAAIILGYVPVCLECNKSVKFLGSSPTTIVGGWRSFCSTICAQKNASTKSKRKITLDNKTEEEKELSVTRFRETMTERYGGHSASNKEVQDKSKKTNLEKYGIEHPSQSKIIKDKIKQTNLEKYGVDSYSKTEEFKEKIKQTSLGKYGTEHPFKSKDVQNKIKQTNLDRYGSENVYQSEIIKDKIKQTNLEKYGVEYIGSSKEIQNKRIKTNFERYGDKNSEASLLIKEKRKETNLEKYGVESNLQLPDLINANKSRRSLAAIKSYIDRGLSIELAKAILDSNEEILKVELTKIIENNNISTREEFSNFTGFYYTYGTYLIRKANLDYLFPVQYISRPESEVYEFVKSLNLEVKQSDRTILSGKELDIYIPSKNLAIEFDGIYWHSVNFGLDKNYHLIKTAECEKQGIQLLHIFESEWEDSIKQEIWKSIIKAKLGLFDRRIYARKCQIKVIDSKTTKLFLNNNHLQGHVNTKNYIGLFYNDELISVMSYGKSRFKDNETEIVRFATLLNTQVIGGFSKLLSTLKTDNLISFADRRYSSSLNSVYSKFANKIEISGPAFWVYDEGVLKHRLGFQKHLLKNKLVNFDENKTAMNNILDNYLVIYDCGNLKYVL